MNRRTLLGSLSASVLTTGFPCLIHADLLDDSSIDKFDKQIDQEFYKFDKELEARFKAMDRAINEAFAEMERVLEKRWGGAAKLPSRTSWVGYDQRNDERVIADYENGKVAVEKQETTDEKTLSKALNDALGMDSEALDKRDVVGQHVDKNARQAGKDAISGGGAARRNQKSELGKLVGDDAKPGHDIRTIRDPDGKTRKVGRAEVSMLPDHKRLSANLIAPVARKYAQRFEVDMALILSIMQNESSFNPRAQSPIPAFGLMQLVPSTGGTDAYRVVHNKKKAPSPDYLFHPDQNIELGCAYLQLLDSEYLKSVSDSESRKYCVISAYNTGAGNVSRAFTGNTNIASAAQQINRMRPGEVHDHLLANLPAEETKNYLRKVLRDEKRYLDYNAT